jgi:hypothetical protein
MKKQTTWVKRVINNFGKLLFATFIKNINLSCVFVEVFHFAYFWFLFFVNLKKLIKKRKPKILNRVGKKK